MLSKPGAARKAPTSSQRRRKQVVEENLDDVVRKLQRVPSNKACADCTSKLTQCVNLTHGTFVCMACSGVHREFNHKIKGIGHSSFTAEEVAMLREPTSGNEAVNAHYLARYSSSDRMKQPQNNNDLQHLREWIRMKYTDKYWSEDRGGRGGASKAGGKKPKAKGERRKVMPKAKESPKQTAPAPVADPFGFDDIASNSAAANDASWDAFGGSTRNSAAAFDADCGGMQNTAPAPDPVPAPPVSAPATAFQPDFGNFGQPQQPTMVAMPPPGPPAAPQQIPTQPPPPEQMQPAFPANFGQAPATQAPAPQQQMQIPQPGQMQQGGFANFSQQKQPQIQQQQPQMQQQGFANFPSAPAPQQQIQPHMTTQPAMQQMQPQQTGMANQQSGGMGFGQAPQQMQMQMQQQGSNVSNGSNNQSGFVQPPQQQMQPQMATQPGQTMQVQQPGMSQPEQQVGMPQPSQPFQSNLQQGAGAMSQQGSAVSSSNGQPVAGQAAMGTTSEASLPSTETESAAVNPNAFYSADDDRKSAFDAFDGLSLEPTPAAYGSSAASEAIAPATAPKKKNLNFAPFHEGQKVIYNNSEGAAMATIAKVHYDDELHPYYTINLNGREKQTDDAHLSLPGESSQNAAVATNGSATVLQETVSMLQKLNPQQLMQIQQFVATMLSGSNQQAAPTSGQPLQMNTANNPQPQQQQQLDIPMAPMGGPPPPSAPVSAPTQMSLQQQQPGYGMQAQPMGMGMTAPTPPGMPPPPAPAQYSAQPQMSTGVTPPSVPAPQQPQQPSSGGMPTQPVGMGTNASAVDPSGMPRPPPVPSSGHMSMNGDPQQAIDTPAAPPAAAAPAPAMPPVEKEGNPFDFY
ncbi:hypothetical protein ACHAXT_008589 [Thalassiosira profunda]